MNMSGETDLEKLLRGMNPELNEGTYAFCTFAADQPIPSQLEPLGTFHEKEGLTLIIPASKADEFGIPCSLTCAWITLNVHSALEAVGLTAAVSQALANKGISCNMVAAYYHDHVFVPLQDAERAMKILKQMTKSEG
jgi:hypothetical protein